MIAIPVSIISTFVVIAGLGLSINVISLAGLAFAVGMVVDASIVSLENIYRLKQSGFPTLKAAYWGASSGLGANLGLSADNGCCVYPNLDIRSPGRSALQRYCSRYQCIGHCVCDCFSDRDSISGSWLIKDVQRFDQQTRIPVIDTLARGFKHLVMSYCRIVCGQRLEG